MRIVSDSRLERFLRGVSIKSISILGYTLIYGQVDRQLRKAEDEKRARENSEGYAEVMQYGRFYHPT
ncbi:hypothetical protein J4218_04390 [Candidatus Pacearchaeota archaeon]|nr:hypothetical protein [Candidatus Pacearchaeota archaeon]